MTKAKFERAARKAFREAKAKGQLDDGFVTGEPDGVYEYEDLRNDPEFEGERIVYKGVWKGEGYFIFADSDGDGGLVVMVSGVEYYC